MPINPLTYNPNNLEVISPNGTVYNPQQIFDNGFVQDERNYDFDFDFQRQHNGTWTVRSSLSNAVQNDSGVPVAQTDLFTFVVDVPVITHDDTTRLGPDHYVIEFPELTFDYYVRDNNTYEVGFVSKGEWELAGFQTLYIDKFGNQLNLGLLIIPAPVAQLQNDLNPPLGTILIRSQITMRHSVTDEVRVINYDYPWNPEILEPRAFLVSNSLSSVSSSGSQTQTIVVQYVTTASMSINASSYNDFNLDIVSPSGDVYHPVFIVNQGNDEIRYQLERNFKRPDNGTWTVKTSVANAVLNNQGVPVPLTELFIFDVAIPYTLNFTQTGAFAAVIGAVDSYFPSAQFTLELGTTLEDVVTDALYMRDPGGTRHSVVGLNFVAGRAPQIGSVVTYNTNIIVNPLAGIYTWHRTFDDVQVGQVTLTITVPQASGLPADATELDLWSQDIEAVAGVRPNGNLVIWTGTPDDSIIDTDRVTDGAGLWNISGRVESLGGATVNLSALDFDTFDGPPDNTDLVEGQIFSLTFNSDGYNARPYFNFGSPGLIEISAYNMRQV